MITLIAQTFTAVTDAIGPEGLTGIVGVLLAALLFLARWSGLRLLTPVVAGIEWFRSHGARDLPLDGLGLSVDAQEQIRSRVQGWLWRSLKDVIAGFAHNLGLSAAFAARVEAITAPLKTMLKDGHAAPPVTITETTDRVKKTTGVMAAFRPDGLPKLALLLAVSLLLGAGGCVSGAVHDAAVVAREAGVILHKSSVPNPAYSPEEQAAWDRLWAKMDDALGVVEEGTK